MKKIKVIFLGILSAGWLLPLCISVGTFQNYIKLTLIPQITGQGFQTSYPFLDMSYKSFVITAVWLTIVIIFWSAHFLLKIDKKSE
jgi:hypothetical protein